MKFYFIILSALLLTSCSTDKTFNQEIQEKNVKDTVEKMNLSLANQEVGKLLACYSSEMDWENSFGWTIRDKKTLEKYFVDWLFVQYPKSGTSRLNFELEVDFLSPDLAWVEVLQEIYSEDLQTVVRTYRQTHLLEYGKNNWTIAKTRMWGPKPHGNPPAEFLSSVSYFQ